MRRIRLLFLLGLWFLGGGVAEAVAVRIESALETEGTEGTEKAKEAGVARIRLLPQQGSASAEALTFSLPVPGDILAEVPAGLWRVEPELEGFWAEPRWLSITPGAVTPDVRLSFFTAGVLEGSVAVVPPGAEGKEVLESLKLRFSGSPRDKARLPRAEVVCPVEDQRFRCRVPAGHLDLRLKAEPAAAVYLWDLEVRPDRARDLGPLRLVRGASAVGWVQVEAGKAPSSPCRVTLAPHTYGGNQDRETALGLRSLVLEAETDERGFFQFVGVPPGAYRISAVQRGLAPTQVLPVEVLPDLEAEVRSPLVVAKRVPARFELDPPLDPYGRPWKIRLDRHEELADAFTEASGGVASREGVWEPRPGVSPGSYRLLVSGLDGSDWVDEEAEVLAGQAPHRIEVPVLRVLGRVRKAGEPLAAVIWLGGLHGSRKVRFESSEDGEFEGYLPGEGTWGVDIVSEPGALRLRLDPVEVRKADGFSHATVEIEVPDTRLHGDVVDEESRPLPGARVSVAGPGKRSSWATTDKDGRFEFSGLHPGAVSVEAGAEGRTSGWVNAEVKEGGAGPSLRLVARGRMTIQGQVFSSQGPVPGARIEAWPSLGEVGTVTIENTMTGSRGEFSLSVPAGARALDLIVAAPRHAWRFLRIPVERGKLVDIPLSEVGGTLVLDFAGLSAAEIEAARGGILIHGGSFLPVFQVERWIRTHGGERGADKLVLANVEAGDYWFCVGNAGMQAVRNRQEPPPSARCAQGTLAPLRELALKLAPSSSR